MELTECLSVSCCESTCGGGGELLSLNDLPSFSKVTHTRMEKWREGALSVPGSQGKDRDGFFCLFYT